MNRFQTYQVFPRVPEPIRFLATLSRNMWWCWHMDAIELFRRIDPRLWYQSGRNPILFSTLIPQKRLEEVAADRSFLAQLNRIREKFEAEVPQTNETSHPFFGPQEVVAYFSMEFGIHETLPLFAGGLGVLAGDHLKAASDVALPVVGIGLLYRQGYFHQYLDQDGGQQEEYPETDLFFLPTARAKNDRGEEIRIALAGPEGEMLADVWRVDVGRVPLYLLDTNLPENPPRIRDVTARLYTGNAQQRLAQEILLGIGGLRALKAMNINPAAVHLNEGHSAFSSIERLAQTMAHLDVDLQTALEIVPRTTVFTTHTPVAAGHDEFPPDLVRPYLLPFEQTLGTHVDRIISWGQPEDAGPHTPLSMFVLGLRMSHFRNGVSALHGQVARRMWAHVWPGWPEDEVPIAHVTNGVHIPSWVSMENARLFERYLGPDWYLQCDNPETVQRIDDIYDEELWRAHEMSRSRLVRNCRTLMIEQYSRRNAPKATIDDIATVLDPEVLTVGFARRFATYKRATLLLQDPERLESIITSKTHPVQFIFAGKAHPRDHEGKDLIRQLIAFCSRPQVRSRIIFLEDYNIDITRNLIQGVDVWLNTPRRPMEACGTSGIKAAANGVLNLSVLDGWWAEGYTKHRGWAIGEPRDYADLQYQDEVESQALYNVLENGVIHRFYERKNNESPLRWIGMMKASMKMAMNHFCSHGMVNNYEQQFYRPAVEHYRAIAADPEVARQYARQRARLRSLWQHIRIQAPLRPAAGPYQVGQTFEITAEVSLGEIQPAEVDVQLYYGRVKTIDTVAAGMTKPMRVIEKRDDGAYLYGCAVDCEAAGRFGFTVRVVPHGDDHLKYMPGLISWA